MKLDGALFGELGTVPERIRHLEEMGYDGAFSAEINSDPFLPLAIAAEHSHEIDLMTSIAVAFSRNPMTVAGLAHDLNAFSKGRFVLGLGSQIRPHITKRFSMPWSRPATRMREFILAMRAIWDCWYEGAPLRFEGEFYNHTLMTPMFHPSDKSQGAPRVVLAAVGPKMAEIAGEVADGILAHAFTTERYLREVTIPAVERGLAASGRQRDDFEIACPLFVVTGADEQAIEACRTVMKRQIGFYGSTPAYRPVLELHGWGELQTELNLLSKRGEWDAMGEAIGDDVLETFAVVAEPTAVATRVRERFSDVLDRLTCTIPFSDPDQNREFVAAIRHA